MFDYDDIGGKIKSLALASFVVEAFAAIMIGFTFLIVWGFEDAWWALFIMLFGPLVAWVGSWFVYGFGEIVERVSNIDCKIKTYTDEDENSFNGQSNDRKSNYGRSPGGNHVDDELERLHKEGVISDEEYERQQIFNRIFGNRE